MKRISQQSVIVMTAATAIVISILTVSMVIPQAAYTQEYQGNQSSSSSDNCAADQLPASINGTIQCMRQGECYSEEFEFNGKEKEVEHCNFMMSNQ
jgi:hypothetical protein